MNKGRNLLGDFHNPITKPEIFIFLPGFPGEAVPRKENEVRVVDIVSNIMFEKNKVLEIVCYPGISDSNDFSFERTQNVSFEVIQKKIIEGFSVIVIGQSWGGLIALLAFDAFPLQSLILITPFLLIPDEADVLKIIKDYSKQFPQIIPGKKIPELVQQISHISKKLNGLNFESISEKNISLLTCSDDEVIPSDLLRKYIKSLGLKSLMLDEIKSDHNFNNGKQDLYHWLELHL